MEPTKNDWKLFKDKIGLWQEAYMEKLVGEYKDLLTSEMPASSKFWELEKRINGDKKKPGVILSVRKSDMFFDILRLLNDGAITMEDLSDFSESFKDSVRKIGCL